MRNFQILLLLAVLLSSCGQYKRFTYIQPSAATMHDTVFIKDFSQYKLQPADILKVDVLSIDKNVTEMFNKDVSSTTSTGGATGGTYYLMGYSVDPQGNIHLPILGELPVAGLTVSEVKNQIQAKATEYLKDAQIEVKLLSFKIYFFG
ncbi:MAG TPA: polysaccharide biosynthesis/export family protein [Bacteroidales bacterium]|nr:polysaccharide biosynthesis/export family protein [Bacteroidales bacterium]